MNATKVLFVFWHIRALAHLKRYQWFTILGASVSAFGASMYADPKHLQVAVSAAVGALIVAIIHVLQPNNTEKIRVEAPKLDSAGRMRL